MEETTSKEYILLIPFCNIFEMANILKWKADSWLPQGRSRVKGYAGGRGRRVQGKGLTWREGKKEGTSGKWV